MKKIITSILFLSLCTLLSAQSIFTVSGVATNADGSAAEGVFMTIAFDNGGMEDFVLTNEEGFYEFTFALNDSISQGCFELVYIDCTFEPVIYSDCYYPGNLDFNFDFVYCANGSDTCSAFIINEYIDSSIVLSVFSFGNPPFTYLWSDGSTGETLVLPLNTDEEVCVEVTDAEGCVANACIDFTPPDACFVHIFEEYNFDSVVLFAEGWGQTDNIEYVWSTGETGEIITVTESAEYCVTLTDGLGCESVDCRYIDIDSTWFEDCFAYIYSAYEQGSFETLYVTSFGVAPFSYVWSFGDSIVSTSDFYVPQEAGVYCVEVTDAEGCVFFTCYDYFIWEDCGVWIGCDPIDNGVQLWAFGYGAEPLQYVWSNGDEGPELIVTESGEYCVTITDAEGCISSACLNVDVEGVSECFVPIELTDFENTVILTLNLNTDGPYDIIWSTGETTSSITVDESGVYCVDVFEIETGCAFSTCETVIIGGQEECWGYIETEYTSDSTAILSVVALNSGNDSLGFQYQWSNGEFTQSIEVDVEGTYCVTAFGANNCVFETCTDVIFGEFPSGNSIIGFVYDSETGEPLDAQVDIYTVLDDGTVELYSEGNETLEQGVFFANNIESGSYIVLANVEGGFYVPTYATSATFWDEADVFTVDDNTAIIAVEIAMVRIINVEGLGTIEGSVTTDNLKANEKEIGTRGSGPLVGANVMLMHTDLPVGQLFTDDEGNYKFTGLPFGTYDVILEIPGLPRKVVEVTLSEESPNANNVEFETDATSTATNDIVELTSLTLSPNPTSNILIVETIFTDSKEVAYKVIDMNGRIIKSSTFQANVGGNSFTVDVSNMESGMYNLVLQTEGELITKRFIKM